MSVTPEIETDGGFDECPNCYAEIDTWTVEKRGIDGERARIIALLLELDVIRRDALGDLVAFNTDGTDVIYLTGLEGETE